IEALLKAMTEADEHGRFAVVVERAGVRIENDVTRADIDIGVGAQRGVEAHAERMLRGVSIERLLFLDVGAIDADIAARAPAEPMRPADLRTALLNVTAVQRIERGCLFVVVGEVLVLAAIN